MSFFCGHPSARQILMINLHERQICYSKQSVPSEKKKRTIKITRKELLTIVGQKIISRKIQLKWCTSQFFMIPYSTNKANLKKLRSKQAIFLPSVTYMHRLYRISRFKMEPHIFCDLKTNKFLFLRYKYEATIKEAFQQPVKINFTREIGRKIWILQFIT